MLHRIWDGCHQKMKTINQVSMRSVFADTGGLRYIAMVIDRFQLYLFLAVTIGGTIGILINAPHIFEYVDQDAVKAKIMGTSPTE